MTIPRPWRTLARLATAAGWTIRRTSRGHLLWISPAGARVVTSGSPGDRRAVANHPCGAAPGRPHDRPRVVTNDP